MWTEICPGIQYLVRSNSIIDTLTSMYLPVRKHGLHYLSCLLTIEVQL